MPTKALKPFQFRKNKKKSDGDSLSSSQTTGVPDTWCPVPWVGMGVRSVGDFRYCCHANGSKGNGLVRDEYGKPIKLEAGTFSRARNADLTKEVRKKMLAGEKHEGCQRCYKEEDAGIVSRRKSEKLAWKEYDLELFKRHTEIDGKISEEKFPTRYLDLRFGNHCNLKCRMCGPTESNKWYALTEKVWGVSSFKDGEQSFDIIKNDAGQYQLKVDPYSWHESQGVWRELESVLPKMQRIYLVGGEPLLIDSHFDFLQHCVEQDYARNITLEYNSNISLITERALTLWSHFRKIEIGMSIDGIGPVNDYIRSGSSWPLIEKNIRQLDRAEGMFKLWWASTIQIYNLMQLPEMMRWIVKQNFERVNQSFKGREILTPHPLKNPSFLAISVFPEKSKKKIVEIFEEEKRKFAAETRELEITNEEQLEINNRVNERFARVLDNYIRIMNAKDDSHLRKKFWDYTSRLDEIHGLSLKEVSPITYELMQ